MNRTSLHAFGFGPLLVVLLAAGGNSPPVKAAPTKPATATKAAAPKPATAQKGKKAPKAAPAAKPATPPAPAQAPLPTIIISAPKLSMDYRAKQGVYKGGVKVLRGDLTMTCESLQAWFGEKDAVQRITAQGNVVAVEGTREAHAANADYDNRSELLMLTGSPMVRDGKRTVRGSRIAIDRANKKMNVNQSTTTSPMEAGRGKGDMLITAPTLSIDETQRTAEWKGGVTANRPPTVVRAPLLLGTWKPDGKLEHLTARGGVEVSEPNRWAKGKIAEYDMTNDVVVLTGEPEARQEGSWLRGSRVTFRPASDVLEVEDAILVIEGDGGVR